MSEDGSVKRILWIVMAMALTFTGQAFAQKAGSERALDFQRYDSYFEGNNSGLKGETSYLAFTGQAQFDKIFHSAAVGGQNNFLPDNVFDSKVVLATIARGHFLRT